MEGLTEFLVSVRMVLISQKVRNRYPGTYKLLAPIYWRVRDSKSSDKLTSYNGKAITYDAIGNPLTYDGYTFKWEGGRTLSSITGNSKNISYKYNSDGIRTDKTVDGVNYKYTLEGNKVVYEEITNGSAIDKIVYNYGDSGLVGFTLNGTEYFYIRNAQSDIIGMLDSDGTQVVSYTYDTWVKLISITGDKVLGEKNPYRYRGYRYDTETGYYYLQSRYYNPQWERFLNADALISIGQGMLSSNMFIYCYNNVINMKDSNGFRPGPICGDDDYDFEGYNRNERDRARTKNPMRPSDSKKKEKRDIDSALGKRGSKEREQKSRELHNSKKKNGDANYNNKAYDDLVNGNFHKFDMSPVEKIVLVGAGIAIIGGTIVEDVATGGLGIADDGITITAGGALIIRAFGGY